jgi:hypothetical protein
LLMDSLPRSNPALSKAAEAAGNSSDIRRARRTASIDPSRRKKHFLNTL